MKMSNYFIETERETPSEIQFPGQQFLLRAGYFRPLAAGIYTYLPFGLRCLRKIEGIIRSEMEKNGALEISMPLIQPAELWKESQRWYKIDAEMGRFIDRNSREMVLAMTHEEAVADLTRRLIHSYRQLPALVYQIQIKFRDDPRPRGGLIRTREFTMKDGYSLDTNSEGLDRQYKALYQAYFNIFRKCGMDVLAVKSDTGIMGGSLAHEFMVLTPIGEDTIFICNQCHYSANRQVASFAKSAHPRETSLPLEQIATPDCKTIDELADYLAIPKSKTAKAVFFMANMPGRDGYIEKFVFAVIRGDLEINEMKLARVLDTHKLRPATELEIKEIGAVPGYASPIGISNAMVVIDDSIPESVNLVAGANIQGYHLRNVNYPRDFSATYVADIASAQDGDLCAICQSPLYIERAVEVGHIYKLDSEFSNTMGCTFQDLNGQIKPIQMGCYGIGIGRVLSTIAEIYRDEHGLCWPISVSPFQIHLIYLRSRKGTDIDEISEKVYMDLISAGFEVLYDDRDVSAGVKFMDSDLIGLPIRLTISERSIKNGGGELKLRSDSESQIVPLESIVGTLRQTITQLFKELEDKLSAVIYQ